MENYNNSLVTTYEELLKNKEKAANQMSEGNLSLESLLLLCFNRGIITRSCCAGHEVEGKRPYFSFSYNPKNEVLLKHIIGKLGRYGYIFQYVKLSNGESSFVITESHDFDFSKQTLLFKYLTDIIMSNIKADKSVDLPDDLDLYMKLIGISEKDELLDITKNKGNFQIAYFNKHYHHYYLFCSDLFYAKNSLKSGFERDLNDGLPLYFFSTKDNETSINFLESMVLLSQNRTNETVKKMI